MAEIHYKIGDGIWILYTEPFVIYEQGGIIFLWYCVDFDGNESAEAFYILFIDYSKPEIISIRPDRPSGPILIEKNINYSFFTSTREFF